MITNYFRPKTLDEAIQLLVKLNTRPLGGGTVINQHSNETFEVVDLQALGLDKIHKRGEKLEIGATTTLQALLESAHAPETVKTCAIWGRWPGRWSHATGGPLSRP
jgi:CO/xanthine dehydrogenase FAD-binding subunit